MIDILVISHSCLTAVNRKIYRELKQLGWSIEILIPETYKIGESIVSGEADDADDPPIHRLPVTSSHPRLSTYRRLFKLIKQIRPSLILLENSPASLTALQLSFWARLNKFRLVCLSCDNVLPSFLNAFFHGRFKDAILSVWYRIIAAVNKNINHIFTISCDGMKMMRRLGYPHVSQIPLGYDPKLFFHNDVIREQTREKLKLQEPTIAYFGRLNPEKGVHILVEALHKIMDLRWQLLLDNFNVYANGYSEKVTNLIKTYGLESRVVRFDASHREMPAYINAADIVVVPSISTGSWKEQYGRVVPEAMACGRLVMVSDCGSLPELVDDSGIIFPQENVEVLAQHLRDSLSGPGIQKKYELLAQERAKKNFSIDRQKKLMHEIFLSYLSKKN